MNPIDLRITDPSGYGDMCGKKDRLFYMDTQESKEDSTQISFYDEDDNDIYPEQSWRINKFGYVLGKIPYRNLDDDLLDDYNENINRYHSVSFLTYMCDQVLRQHKEKPLRRPKRRVRRTLRKAKRK